MIFLYFVLAVVVSTAAGVGIGLWAGRRRLEPLRRSVEREQRLVGDVGHELRTPLTTLVTSVGVLKRYEEDLPERSRLALGLISDEVEHLRRVLDDMLALARIEAGLHARDAETLWLGELLAHTLSGRRHAPELLTAQQDVPVRGRKLELERAFANLLDNAVRHGGGIVAVTLHRVGDQAVILIDDAGPGVAAADRERIFERFATARASRRTATGTGIGLALVTETIAAHGGRVDCGERPGGGARFAIRLPISKDTQR